MEPLLAPDGPRGVHEWEEEGTGEEKELGGVKDGRGWIRQPQLFTRSCIFQPDIPPGSPQIQIHISKMTGLRRSVYHLYL